MNFSDIFRSHESLEVRALAPDVGVCTYSKGRDLHTNKERFLIFGNREDGVALRLTGGGRHLKLRWCGGSEECCSPQERKSPDEDDF